MTPFRGTNRVTSPYGWRTLNSVREFHCGQDIVGDNDWNVRAIWDAARCEVAKGYNGGRGNLVTLYYNDGLRVLYQHLADSIPVVTGSKVKQGDRIGLMGNTGYSFGAHLHIEVQLLQSGRWVPVEPWRYTEVPNTVDKHPGNDNLDKVVTPPAVVTPPPLALYTLTIGPMTAGDKNTLEAQSTALGLPVKVDEG